MGTKIVIHQPNYLPWAGYFNKMRQADLFVVLDNVPYSKNSYINRVKIKDGKWLTLPIQQQFGQSIRDIRLCDIRDPKRHIEILKQNYKDTRYFDYTFGPLFERMKIPWKFLSTFNTTLLTTLVRLLEIKTGFTQASHYNFKGKGDDLLIEICKRFKANTYLSGEGGENYQDENKFREAGIEIEYVKNDYPDVSIVDLMSKYGSSVLDQTKH